VKGSTLRWVADTFGRTAGRMLRHDLAGRPDRPWHGATVDTRRDCRDRLFFAFEGEQTDGHRFATEATARGCAAVVLEQAETAREIESAGDPFFLVDDTLSALQDLARAYRDRLPVTVVAVTGSSGKTTTKEFTGRVLAQKYRVYSSPESFNSRIGVPLTILDVDVNDDYLVAEVGANRTGEIASLSRLLKPAVGVVTNIGLAHVGLFGSRENIALAKAELLEAIPDDGLAVLPGDDEFLPVLKDHFRGRISTFGYGNGCDYRITSVKNTADSWEFEIGGQLVAMKTAGRHNLLNAAAALAVGELCGVALELGRSALSDVQPLGGRGRVIRTGGITLYDDSYNANPGSLRAALTALLNYDGRRRLAILGDMNELGDFSRTAHRELGEFMADLGLDLIFWIGDFGDEVADGYRRMAGSGQLAVLPAGTEPAAVTGAVRPGDVVLVKGSRACRLERFVDGLLEMFGANEVN
jgi:UDP-N-acetylmuramoyl-tripeptide--D-alanyl-D-alanine ligase